MTTPTTPADPAHARAQADTGALTEADRAARPAPHPRPSPIVRIQITRAPGFDLPLPAYQTSGAAGMDLSAAIEGDITIPPGEWRLVPAGVHMAIPEGLEGQVRPRSGLALRHGVTVLNAPGTVDSDYRGELKVALVNHGKEPFVVRRGERIAQLLICPVVRAEWEPVAELAPTSRGAGGYGSTGR